MVKKFKKCISLLVVFLFIVSIASVTLYNQPEIEEQYSEKPAISIGDSPTQSDERLIRTLSNGNGDGDPPADQYYFVDPDGGDSWTENSASSWGYNLVTVSDESTIKQLGTYSIKGTLKSAWRDECNDESVDTSLYDVYSEDSGYATEDTSHITIWSSPTNGDWAFLSFDSTNYPLSGDYNVTFRMRDCWGPGGRILWLSFCKSSDIPNKGWSGPRLVSSTSSDSPLIIYDGSSSEELRSTTDTEYTITVTRVGSTVTVYYNDTQEWSGTFTEPGGAHDTFSFGVTGSSTGNRDVNLDWIEYNNVGRELYYNSSKNLSLDCSETYEFVNFRIRQDNQTDDPELHLYYNNTNYMKRIIDVTTNDTWQTETVAVGNDASGWIKVGDEANATIWADIDYVSLYYNSSKVTITTVYLDGLYFDSSRIFEVDSFGLMSTNVTPSYTTDINEADITAADGDSFDVSWNGTSWSLTNIVYGSDLKLDFNISTDFEAHSTTLVFSDWDADVDAPSITHSVITQRDPNYPDDLDDYVYINATVIDSDNNLDTVLICHNVSASFVNYSMSNTYEGDIYNYTMDIQSLSAEDRVEYIFYANDTYDNQGVEDNSGANYTFTLGTGDIDPPEITLDAPANESIVSGSTWFNFSIADVSSIEWLKINWNEGENVTVADPYDHLNDTTVLSDGTNTLYTYANDSVGNIASEVYIFTVDNTAPSIILVDPSNSSTVEQYDSINIAVTDLSSFTVKYNWNGGSNLSLESPYDLSMPYDSGTHYLYVYANDTHGFWNFKKYMFVGTVSPGTGGGGGGGGLEAIAVDIEYPLTFVVGETVEITVYVNDTKSKPVSDMNIIAKYSDGIAVFEETTDGVYVTEISNLKLGVNDLTIVVSKTGYATYEKRVTIRGYESEAAKPILFLPANWMTNIWLYYGQTLIMAIILIIGATGVLYVANKKGLIELPQIGLRKLKFPSIGVGRRKLKLPDIGIEKRKIRKPSLPSKVKVRALPSRKFEKALFADRTGIGMNWMVFAVASIGISVWMLNSLFTSPQAAGAIWFYAFSLAVPLIVVSLYISWRLGEKTTYEPGELIFTSENPFAAIIYGVIILVPISMLLFTISTYLATGINPFVMAPLHKQQIITFPWGALSGYLVNVFLQFIVAAGENIALLILPTLIFDAFGVESRRGQMFLSASAFSAFHYFAAAGTVGIVYMFPYFFFGGAIFWLATFGAEKDGLGFNFPQGGFFAGFVVHLIANLMTIGSASVLFV